ncbi:molybdenum cofactor guanylyltransferase MobA [Martelella mangrovi]|uniref:Molybdenum cofactor guanylyltransferase n=1 Tax=Martelella mangrovi TaxID=1397477 RepID=A0ABV2I6T1_9HYPH
MSPALPPAVILAGGASQRMGTDKAMLEIDGETLLARAHRQIALQASPVLVSRHGADMRAPPGAIVVRDIGTDHEGPLAGILAALDHLTRNDSPATHMISVAVDTPFFPADLVARLTEARPAENEIVLAQSEGRVHPVFALWPLALHDDLTRWFATGSNRRLMDFVKAHPHRTVDFSTVATPEGAVDPFFNINTPQDLDTARQIAKLTGNA